MITDICTVKVPSSGSNRFSLCLLVDFFRRAIKMNSKIIINKLLELNFVNFVLDLFSSYPVFSALHLKIVIILEEYLYNLFYNKDFIDPKLIKAIFETVKLLNDPTENKLSHIFKRNQKQFLISPLKYFSRFLGLLLINLSQDFKNLNIQQTIFEDPDWKKFYDPLLINFIHGLSHQIVEDTTKNRKAKKGILTISRIIKNFNPKSAIVSNISEVQKSFCPAIVDEVNNEFPTA